VAVFGGTNQPTQDISQAPNVPRAVTSSPLPPATLSDDEYRNAIAQDTAELVQSIHRFVTLWKNAHPHDDSWRNAILAEFALWQAYHERAQKRVPPSQFAEPYAKYVHSLALLADAGKQYARGIDDDNPREIDAGTEEMKAAYAEVKAAVSLIPAR
jgi:hypothetical protein